MKVIKAVLKSYFTTGKKPSESNFVDLFDSLAHIDEIALLNSAAINSAINTYDTALKARNSNGIVDSLGDIIKVFEGYADTTNLKDKLAALTTASTWAGIPGRPATAAINWSKQTLVVDNTVFNPADLSGGIASGPELRWLLKDVRGLNTTANKYAFTDLRILRKYYSISGVSLYVDAIASVEIITNPSAQLSV